MPIEKEKTYGVWAVRSAASIFGRAESWCKEDGRPLEFASHEAAEAYAKECNSHTTANVHYFVKEKEPEPGAVRKDGIQPDRDARAHEEIRELAPEVLPEEKPSVLDRLKSERPEHETRQITQPVSERGL